MKYPFRTDFEDDDFHLAHAGPFVFMNWRGRYQADSFARIEGVHHRLAERQKVDVTGVSVVEAESPIPGEDIRAAGSDMMTRTQSTTKAVVIIFLDEGFTASTLQSVAARELSMGGRVPMKFFHNVLDAAEWLAQVYPKLELATEDLVLWIETLRVRYAPSRLSNPPSANPDRSSSYPDRLSSHPPRITSKPDRISSNPPRVTSHPPPSSGERALRTGKRPSKRPTARRKPGGGSQSGQ